MRLEDKKLDTLYTCHDRIEDSINKLHTLLEHVNMPYEDYAKVQIQFDKVMLEVYQLQKELRYY